MNVAVSVRSTVPPQLLLSLRLWIRSRSCFGPRCWFLGSGAALDFTVRTTGGVLRASVTTVFPGFISEGSTGFGHSQGSAIERNKLNNLNSR